MPNPTCSVDGCRRSEQREGWCLGHYARVIKTGEPGSPRFPHRAPDARCDADGCDRPVGRNGAHGYCQKHAYRLRTNGHPLLTRPPGSPAGPSNPSRLPVVKYQAAHRRIQRLMGKAADHICASCGEPAHDWAYQHSAECELIDAETGLPYSLDPEDYLPMCHTCHNRMDAPRSRGGRGVSFDSRRNLWRAYVHRNGRQHQAGAYRTEAEALRAARKKRAEIALLDDLENAPIREGS